MVVGSVGTYGKSNPKRFVATQCIPGGARRARTTGCAFLTFMFSERAGISTMGYVKGRDRHDIHLEERGCHIQLVSVISAMA